MWAANQHVLCSKQSSVYLEIMHMAETRDCKWGDLHSPVANLLDWDIVVSKFEIQSRYYIPNLGIHMCPLSPWLWTKQYHLCFLNKDGFIYMPRMLICHWTKKPNQFKQFIKLTLSPLYIYQPLRSDRIWHKVNF